MAIALDLITGALIEINAYAPGEALSAADANDALLRLNDLLDSWSNEHITVFNNDELLFTFSPGKKDYTIGPGGDFNAPRPLRITNAYTRITTNGQGIDFPCAVITGDQYTGIGLKSQPGPWPKALYYNMSMPLGSLFFWPVPTQAGELHLWVDMIFSGLTLQSPVTLPQGYARALRKNLAVELAPVFGKEPSDLLALQARESKAAVRGLNNQPTTPSMFDAGMPSGNRADAGYILHGGFQ